MNISHRLGKFAAEAARALRNFKFDLTDRGIYIPTARVTVGGVFGHMHAAAVAAFDPDKPLWQPWSPMVHDHNRVVTEGLIQLLNSALAGVAPITSYYLAPFGNNTTPDAAWTAATFADDAGEFTAYTSGTRLAWNRVAATVTPVVGNSASIAQMIFNASGGPFNVYGLGLLSSSTKESTAGKLMAATRFDTPRTNMAVNDKLGLEYVFEAKDEADV